MAQAEEMLVGDDAGIYFQASSAAIADRRFANFNFQVEWLLAAILEMCWSVLVINVCGVDAAEQILMQVMNFVVKETASVPAIVRRDSFPYIRWVNFETGVKKCPMLNGMKNPTDVRSHGWKQSVFGYAGAFWPPPLFFRDGAGDSSALWTLPENSTFIAYSADEWKDLLESAFGTVTPSCVYRLREGGEWKGRFAFRAIEFNVELRGKSVRFVDRDGDQHYAAWSPLCSLCCRGTDSKIKSHSHESCPLIPGINKLRAREGLVAARLDKNTHYWDFSVEKAKANPEKDIEDLRKRMDKLTTSVNVDISDQLKGIDTRVRVIESRLNIASPNTSKNAKKRNADDDGQENPPSKKKKKTSGKKKPQKKKPESGSKKPEKGKGKA